MTPWIGVVQGLRALRAADRRRAGVPGEHWATFGAAVTTIAAARGIRSGTMRAAVMAVGGLLVLRAISGRDGALAVAKRAARRRGLIRDEDGAARHAELPGGPVIVLADEPPRDDATAPR